MFAAFPLLALPVIVYNLLALTAGKGASALQTAQARMAEQLFVIKLPNQAAWSVSLGDLLLAASLVVLFVELLKSTTSRKVAIINHSLSMLLFIICLIEFLLAPSFATSTYFLITLMVLLDVLAGFIVSIVSARRDMDVIEN